MPTLDELASSVSINTKKPPRPNILDMDYPRPGNDMYDEKGSHFGIPDAVLEVLVKYIFEESKQFMPMIEDAITMAKLSIPNERLSFDRFQQSKKRYQEVYDYDMEQYQEYLQINGDPCGKIKSHIDEIIQSLKSKNDIDNFTSLEFACSKKFHRVWRQTKNYRKDLPDFHDMIESMDWDSLSEKLKYWKLDDYQKFVKAVSMMVANIDGIEFDYQGNKVR